MINGRNNNAKILYTFIILILILYSKIAFSQERNDLIIEFEKNEIGGDDFKGNLSMSIKNVSSDTIYIAMEPITFSYYCNSDTLIFFPRGRSGYYNPLLLQIIERNAKIFYVDVRSRISYLKFPRILYLYPGSRTTIFFTIENANLLFLKSNKWDIYKEVGYSYKSNVDTTLINKPDYLKCEFIESIFYKDTIDIKLTLKPKSLDDSLLFISKDGMNYDYNYESIYDSIIFRCFIQRVYDK